jgi:hypothetical protein
MFAASETFAGSGAAHAAGFIATHSISHPPMAHAFRHHRRSNGGIFWPDAGGLFDGPSHDEPIIDATQPKSGDPRYTDTYDIPWDWAHRYPPSVIPSERPYVSSCPAENVTVPGHDGTEQTVTIMRCY